MDESSSGGTIQVYGDSGKRPGGGAAAAFDETSRLLAHLFHALWIAKRFNPRHAYVLGTLHLNRGAR